MRLKTSRCIGKEKAVELEKLLEEAKQTGESVDVYGVAFDFHSGRVLDRYQEEGIVNIISTYEADVTKEYSIKKLLDENRAKINNRKSGKFNETNTVVIDADRSKTVEQNLSELLSKVKSINGDVKLVFGDSPSVVDKQYALLLIAYTTGMQYEVSKVINGVAETYHNMLDTKQKLDTTKKYRVIKNAGEILEIYFNEKEGMWIDQFGRYYSNSKYEFPNVVLPWEFGEVDFIKLRKELLDRNSGKTGDSREVNQTLIVLERVTEALKGIVRNKSEASRIESEYNMGLTIQKLLEV